MKKTIATCWIAAGLLVGCTSETEPGQDTQNHGHSHENVYSVACGCSLKKDGKCGNFVRVEDEFIPLVGDIGLDDHAFCQKRGVLAELEGEVKDGKFVATSYAEHKH